MTIDPLTELDALAGKRTAALADAMARLAAAGVNGPRYTAALADVATILAQTAAIADLLGRRRLLLELDAHRAQHVRTTEYARVERTKPEDENLIVPAVPFEDAIQNLIDREPRLAPSQQEVSDLYNSSPTGRFFALAKSIDEKLSARVRERLTADVLTGEDHDVTARAIADIGDWTRAYAETVYRTNLNDAYTHGRMAQAKDPDVARTVAGFRFTATQDADCRPNHLAADGFLAGTDDPVWATLRPPLGYACRCVLEFATRDELADAGLIDAGGMIRPARLPDGAHPDEGFR